MLKRYTIEIQRAQIVERERTHWLRFFGHRQNRLEHIQRGFGLAVDVDDVPELLQRAEDEEGVDPEREELANGDVACIDQVEHQEEDAGAQEVDRGALDEAEAAQVFHLLQLELENFPGRAVQPLDLLLTQAEALDELDV